MTNFSFVNISKIIQNFVTEQVEKDNFSGSYLIAKDGKIIIEGAYGIANKKLNIPNSIETVFNLGSVSKMFTAVGIAQLVQENKLSFIDTVGKYITDYPNEDIKNKVTIHHLLSHTSGMGHYLADKKKFLEQREKLITIKSFVEFFQNEQLRFEPGLKYEYSGNGFELLGRIIEIVSGQDYFEYISRNIFQKSAMQNSGFFSVDPNDLNSKIAIGYTNRADDGESNIDGKKRENTWINLIRGGAGGGGYSTCTDLLKFSQSLLSYQLINKEITNTLITPKVSIGTKEGQTLYYGYGFQILDVGNKHYRIGHGGSYAGASARFDMYPWLNITVIVLSNFDEPSAHRIANKAGELILQETI